MSTIPRSPLDPSVSAPVSAPDSPLIHEPPMLILVVEDDASVARFLTRGLTEEGYKVDGCRDGEAALAQGLAQPYDLIILDWMLPGQDGVAVLRHWRARGLVAPVLMLTARDGADAEILALDAGADDYISKPFGFEVLLARLRALLRRSGSPLAQLTSIGQATLDMRSRVLTSWGLSHELSGREFALLDCLLRHRGQVVSRARIMDRVWQVSFDTATNLVDVYIRSLRQKLDPAGCPVQDSMIQTVRGRGYRLRPEQELP